MTLLVTNALAIMTHLVVISYPISDILEPEGRPEQGLTGVTAKDRIALLDMSGGAKWSRVCITDLSGPGVGAVGPIPDPYFQY